MSHVSGIIYLNRISRESALRAMICASVRMMVGINQQSTDDCEWYEGIGHDGVAEFGKALEDFNKRMP